MCIYNFSICGVMGGKETDAINLAQMVSDPVSKKIRWGMITDTNLWPLYTSVKKKSQTYQVGPRN